MASERYR